MKRLLIALLFFPSLSFAGSVTCDYPWELIKAPVSGWNVAVQLCRLSVPHGWLIYTAAGTVGATIFMADEKHEWAL